MERNAIFGRPFATASPDDLDVYKRPPDISPHPGWHDSLESRRAEREQERQIPKRDKATLRIANRLFNSLGMNGGEGELFAVEDARASLSVTPAAGAVAVPVALDRDLILDAGFFPGTEPGAAIYLGVRNFSVTAVATTATGALAWTVQLGNGPFLALGTTPASPSGFTTGIRGFLPFPLPPDRIPAGASIGLLVVTSDTLATPVALRATLGFSLLFSIPEGR